MNIRKYISLFFLMSLLLPVMGQQNENSTYKDTVQKGRVRIVKVRFNFDSGENRCAGEMAEAARLYQEGEFVKSLDMLQTIEKSCRKSNLEIQINELRIRNHLALDQPFEADTVFRDFLDENPNYIPTTTGLEENYLRLYYHYKVVPKWTLGFTADRIYPKFEVAGILNVINDNYDYETVFNRNGFCYGFGNSLTFSTPKGFRLSAYYSYRNLKINREIHRIDKPDFFTVLSETDVFLNAGMELGFGFSLGKIGVELGAGMGMAYLWKSEGVIQASIPDYNNTNSSPDFLIPDNGFDIRFEPDMKPHRRSLNMAPRGKIGLFYNLDKTWSLALDYTFESFVRPYTSSDLFLDEEIMLKTFYIDSDMYNVNHIFSLSLRLNLSNHVINKFPFHEKK